MSPPHQRILNFLLLCFLITLSIQHLFISGVLSKATFTILNKCNYTVWPGIFSAGTNLATTGFTLEKGESTTIIPPSSWEGGLWGRTLCAQNSNDNFTCATGDCGSAKLECSGNNPKPPVTLAEFQLARYNGLDFYDLSLVDGYNFPMLVVPRGVNNCTNIGCTMDLAVCPSVLKVPNGCLNACTVFGGRSILLQREYSTPEACRPTSYSKMFKNLCPQPQAYSYPSDNFNNTHECISANYLITFCPESNISQTPAARRIPNVTQWDAGMVYEGAFGNTSGSWSSTCTQVIRSSLIAGAVTIAASIW